MITDTVTQLFDGQQELRTLARHFRPAVQDAADRLLLRALDAWGEAESARPDWRAADLRRAGQEAVVAAAAAYAWSATAPSPSTMNGLTRTGLRWPTDAELEATIVTLSSGPPTGGVASSPAVADGAT